MLCIRENPSDITVFTYTPEGATLYEAARKNGLEHAAAMKTLSEEKHYKVHIISYDAFSFAPELLRRPYRNAVKKTSNGT